MFGVILSSLGSVLSSALSVVSKLVPALIKIVGVALEKFSGALEAFFKELGLIEPEENMEDLGDRALQAEQDEFAPIKIEDFDSHEKYLAAVREYEVDAEKSALIPQDDKLHKAIEILLASAIAQYGQPMSEFGQIVMSNPEFYSKAGRLSEFASLIRSNPEAFAEVLNYIENKSMSTEKNDAAFGKLVDMEKKISPEATDAEIWATVSDMKK